MMGIVFVGVGGCFGACSRYLITKFFHMCMPGFPFGTLVSNVIAGLLIGFIIGMERQSTALPDHLKLFLTTGLLGGLSTFSSFSMETVVLFEKGSLVLGSLNILLNVGLCLLFVLIGLLLSKAIAAS